MMSVFKKKKRRSAEIAPDEIFLDSHNLPQFDRSQFEGRIERPIGRVPVFVFLGVLALIGCGLLGKTFALQVLAGSTYRQQAEKNRLDSSIIFADRGIIYDRVGNKLAWNEQFALSRSPAGEASTTKQGSDYARRLYATSTGIAHILGFVSYPRKDSAGNYFQDSITGMDGIEKQYNDLLSGSPGKRILEEDALGTVVSESVIAPPQGGQNVTLSIDSRIEDKLGQYMTDLMNQIGFSSGAGVIMDVRTGEILALTSMPSYDSQTMTDGKDTATIRGYNTDPNKPFLDRAISGRYTPGSVVKPFVATGALQEHIIDPAKMMYTDGSLRVPNPYDPSHPTVFKDWRNQGTIDMRHAIAYSSNVYFMTIGGGFGDQKGLGIDGIDTYMNIFGIGHKTGIDLAGEVDGVVPSIAWKKKIAPDEPWRIGDTYNSSIGQYGFQVTILQMVRGIAAIANGGILVTPHLNVGIDTPSQKLPLDPANLEIVREGMRLGAIEGTGKALNYPDLHFAAKTGTAELGVSKEKVNSWVEGFWPYENPRYAFVIVLEKGPVTNLIGSASVMRRLVDWMRVETPEYLTN